MFTFYFAEEFKTVSPSYVWNEHSFLCTATLACLLCFYFCFKRKML